MKRYIIFSMGQLVEPQMGKSVWEIAKLLKQESYLARGPELVTYLVAARVWLSYFADIYLYQGSIINNYKTGKIDSEQFEDAMCSRLGLDSTKTDVKIGFKNAWNSMCALSTESFELLKMIAEFAEKAQSSPSDKKLVIVSSTNPWQYEYIKGEVEKYFEKNELFPGRKDIWNSLIKPQLYLSFEQDRLSNSALSGIGLFKLGVDPKNLKEGDVIVSMHNGIKFPEAKDNFTFREFSRQALGEELGVARAA